MQRNCAFFAVVVMTIVPGLLQAQTTFERYYGGPGRDEAALARPLAGGYVVCGRTMSFGADSGDIWVIWTNLSGDTVRTRRYGIPGRAMRPSDIVSTGDGGFIVAGDARTLGQGDDARDIWLAKVTATGDTQWTRTFGGPLGDENPVVQPVGDGCIVLASYQTGLNSNHDFWLLMLDAGGGVVWEKKYGGAGTDVPKGITPTADGGFILTGYTCREGQPMGDVWLLKTDAAGDTQWTRKYGNDAAFDQGQAVTPTEDGGYLVCGTVSATTTMDWYVVKTNGSGDSLWTKTWGTALYDMGGSCIQVPGGGYVLCGFVNSNYTTTGDLCLLALTTAGDSAWCRTYGGAAPEFGLAAARCPDGGFIIAGVTMSYGTAGDAYLVKTDASGGIGIAEPRARAATRGTALVAWPNPFRTTISLQAAMGGPAEVRIYDAMGRRVRAMPANVGFVWDGRDESGRTLAAGAYRCVLVVRGRVVASRDLVLTP